MLLTGLQRRAGRWIAETSVGVIEAGTVVNAGGAWADRVASWRRACPIHSHLDDGGDGAHAGALSRRQFAREKALLKQTLKDDGDRRWIAGPACQ